MVAGAAFPVAKLGFLLVKQVAKPIAKNIAARAKNSRLFRDYVCIPIAQGFHWYEVKLKMMTMDLGKVTKVPKLNEAKAIEQGSEILSEMIILSIASSILIYEYNRSKEKEEAKEETLRHEREMVKNKIFELEFRIEKQSTQIRELARTAIHLEEEFHKRSLRRIFEQKPKVHPSLVETANEEDPPTLESVTPSELAMEPTNISGAQPVVNVQKTLEHPSVPSPEKVKEKPAEVPKAPGLITASVTDLLEKKNPTTKSS